MLNLCGPCASGSYTGVDNGGICEHSCHLGSLIEVHRAVKEDLILIAAPEADRVRELLEAAVREKDAEVIRREGHLWSGRIGLQILRLADLVAEQPAG